MQEYETRQKGQVQVSSGVTLGPATRRSPAGRRADKCVREEDKQRNERRIAFLHLMSLRQLTLSFIHWDPNTASALCSASWFHRDPALHTSLQIITFVLLGAFPVATASRLEQLLLFLIYCSSYHGRLQNFITRVSCTNWDDKVVFL